MSQIIRNNDRRPQQHLNLLVSVLHGVIEQALTWTAAQIFNAAVTVAANLASALVTLNQSGAVD